MNFDKITAKHLDQLKSRIADTLAAKGIDNTGEASASLEVSGNQLLGNDYLYYLDQGRKSGKFPPSLMGWIRTKLGLEGKEAKQVDFLVRRKISREGTEIYKNRANGIELDSLVSEMLENLVKDVGEAAKVEVLKWG